MTNTNKFEMSFVDYLRWEARELRDHHREQEQIDRAQTVIDEQREGIAADERRADEIDALLAAYDAQQAEATTASL